VTSEHTWADDNATYSMPVVPRYAEIDQQGVVFNGHYLTWFDEALTGFLDHLGVTYPGLIDTGHDLQVVHSEIDYLAPVRWRDSVRVAVSCERVGATSFTLGFTVLRRDGDTADTAGAAESPAVHGHNVYVVVSSEDWAKRPIPGVLRDALISLDGQARNARE
jgi:acyl-CoA thioester hydrolase